MENLIIHISGASGSGKTTLGNKLKKHFKNYKTK
jgi:uridine kinase